MELTERKQNILTSIVNGYIRTGEPVGSKSIAEQVGVSSATVRNEMAELTEGGFLEQPHTSAGRIPSPRGYREYVNHLMQPAMLSESEKFALDAMLLKSAYDPERLLRGAAATLASAARVLCIATAPSGANAQIRAVQFVQTGRRTAMLIMMSSAGTMKTKVFHCAFDLSNEIMRLFFRMLNERVTGKNVADITPALIQSMAVSFGELAILISPAMGALLEVAAETRETEVEISGQMNLLFYPEYRIGGARQVMDVLENKERLLGLLGGKPGRAQIRIGPEMGCDELAESALVCARYAVDGTDAGAIVAVGPMRMPYARVAAQTQYIADRVGGMLTRIMREE